MFNAEEVRTALFGRIGWTKDGSSQVELSEENKKSRSSRYFQDFHRAVVLDNIESNMPTGIEINNFLTDLQNSAILNSLSAVFNEDILIEQTFILNRKSERQIPVANAKKVGYKITLADNHSHCAVIKNVSLLFGDSGTIRLTLQHSNAGVLFEKDVEVEANKETIVDFEQTLFYNSPKYKGGYFLLWYESELKPIEFLYPDFNKTLLFRAEPFEATDFNNLSYTSKSYGLNMEVCVYRDFTEIIKQNQSMFDNVVGLQMSANVIEMIINSTRSNKTERMTKEALQTLYNDLNIAFSSPEFPYSTGIRNQIAREIKRLKNNLFPKSKSQTITVAP